MLTFPAIGIHYDWLPISLFFIFGTDINKYICILVLTLIHVYFLYFTLKEHKCLKKKAQTNCKHRLKYKVRRKNMLLIDGKV